MRTRFSGFTMVELIVILIITGILAITALPRFFSPQTFDARGFYDESLAMVRYAQKTAIAQHRNVFVNVVSGPANKICLSYAADATCAAPTVANPADQSVGFSKNAPSGITFSASVSFAFTAIGAPSPNAQAVISVIGDGLTRTITIERETGYAH